MGKIGEIRQAGKELGYRRKFCTEAENTVNFKYESMHRFCSQIDCYCLVTSIKVVKFVI